MSVFNADQDSVSGKGLIFVVDGQSLKFFLQKDIPSVTRGHLTEQIQALGGICETKVPIRGFIVYQPGSHEARRLRNCWQKPDRPDRHFVPISWIEASKQKGKLIPQIFVEKATARPIKIHIASDIANPNYRAELELVINNYGGEVSHSIDDARIILAPAETEFYREMRRQLQGNDQKFVEHLKWLETCILQEMFSNSPNPIRNPGGRRPGDERTAFSEDDEINLCNWIASVIPYKESGGRTGNKIYQELVSRAHLPGYEWVGRHTWQSWRERYKKNALRLDQHIAAIVNLSQTSTQDKAQFGLFRLTEGRQTQTRKRKRKTKSEMEQSSEALAADKSGPATMSQSQSSQDSEWVIREGNAPPPIWAAQRDMKNESSFRKFVLAPALKFGAGPNNEGQNTNTNGTTHTYASVADFAADFGTPAAMHPIDRAIMEIAQEFQFVPAEVRAFYDRTGDMNATRERFERMRALLNTMP